MPLSVPTSHLSCFSYIRVSWEACFFMYSSGSADLASSRSHSPGFPAAESGVGWLWSAASSGSALQRFCALASCPWVLGAGKFGVPIPGIFPVQADCGFLPCLSLCGSPWPSPSSRLLPLCLLQLQSLLKAPFGLGPGRLLVLEFHASLLPVGLPLIRARCAPKRRIGGSGPSAHRCTRKLRIRPVPFFTATWTLGLSVRCQGSFLL